MKFAEGDSGDGLMEGLGNDEAAGLLVVKRVTSAVILEYLRLLRRLVCFSQCP